MAKAEWGLKRICPNCGTRYYDMKKNPPVCPNCKTAFDPETLVRAKRGRSTPKAEPKPVPEVEIEVPAAEGEEAEDAVIEDAEELGGEEAQLEDVVEAEEP